MLLVRGGRYDEARVVGRRARDQAIRLGLRVEIGGNLRGLGELEMAVGRLAEAEQVLREGVELYEQMGDPAHGTDLASMLAIVLARQGRLDEARAMLERARAWLSPDDVGGDFLAKRAQADVALAASEIEPALEHARASLGAVEDTGYLSDRIEARIALARVLVAAGRSDEATRLLVEAVDLARARGDIRWLRVAEEMLEGLRAEPTGA